HSYTPKEGVPKHCILTHPYKPFDFGRSSFHVGRIVSHVGETISHMGQTISHIGWSLSHVFVCFPNHVFC
ncbi:hypothetical protein, partial [Tannerella sp.]|uniref:hypothetical protein n=1 Tax=Tannerella sp. TaxID=2382127 RepID=UPI0026DD40B3